MYSADISSSWMVADMPRLRRTGLRAPPPPPRQQLQPLLAESLEAVRRGARLEGPSPQDGCPGRLDGVRAVKELRLPSHRAGPRHEGEAVGPDLDIADLDYRSLGSDLPTGQLERLQNRDDVLHARQGLEGLELFFPPLAAARPHHGPVRPAYDVRVVPQLRHAPDHLLHLLFRCPCLHHDDHGMPPTKAKATG